MRIRDSIPWQEISCVGVVVFVCGGRVGGLWPKKSKTKAHLSVDPCITNRVMGTTGD